MAELHPVGEPTRVAKDTATRDRLWEARRKIIDALTHESPINHMEDVVVPRSQIPALLEGIHQIAPVPMQLLVGALGVVTVGYLVRIVIRALRGNPSGDRHQDDGGGSTSG